eukprot:5699451-Prymnesium_polylepis.1
MSSSARYLVYGLFTSHVEAAINVGCDTAVVAALLYDWTASVFCDLRLRLNLNRLRGGYFRIKSRHLHAD